MILLCYSLNSKHDYDQFLSRLAAIPSFLSHNIELIREGMQKGKIPPKIIMVGVVDSITATRFNFKNPVYLQNNSQYALVIETDSTDYQLWASKLGESDIATSITVTTQPALGSLYKSQNIDNWTEDLFEDVKFSLYRAEFDISKNQKALLSLSASYKLS